ncbi:hypothetical protein C8Q72DRAFT_339287 [Fomitopsis betulina]|nr:hypothetical protein C8Q72DRAFT_339287 [Fomitopsis betulina]
MYFSKALPLLLSTLAFVPASVLALSLDHAGSGMELQARMSGADPSHYSRRSLDNMKLLVRALEDDGLPPCVTPRTYTGTMRENLKSSTHECLVLGGGGGPGAFQWPRSPRRPRRARPRRHHHTRSTTPFTDRIQIIV